MAEKIDLRPRGLEIIQKHGPVIPRDLVKEIGGDTFIVGAVLMQLKDSGKIFVSNTKVGGTPTYYCEGQEERLQNLEKYLNDKEKYAFNLLKESKVLRDYDQPTVVRLSLRLLKDFAIPLVVEVHGEDEIFWKWYMTSLSDAEEMIKEKLPLIKPHVLEEVKEEKKIQEDVTLNVESDDKKAEESVHEAEETEEEIQEAKEEKQESEEIIEKEIDKDSKEEIKEVLQAEEVKEEKEIEKEETDSEEFSKEEIKKTVEKKSEDKKIDDIKTEKPKKSSSKPLKKENKTKKVKKNTKGKVARGKPKKEGFFKKIKKFFWQ